MIRSFADRDTQELFHSGNSRRFAAIARPAMRKLIQINQARRLGDLAVPPGNHLEALKGEWSGWYSVRVNNQWRLVFKWTDSGPAEVGIIDYH